MKNIFCDLNNVTLKIVLSLDNYLAISYARVVFQEALNSSTTF